jgi:hypothetical protein
MPDLQAYIDALPETRRERFVHMMSVIQDANPAYDPKLWDSGIVGFGSYHYEYPSGRKGESMQLGISNRARYIALYACGADDTASIADKFRDQLPGCKIGKSCIEVPDKAVVDDAVLADMTRAVADSFQKAMRKPKEPGKTYIRE